MTKKSSESISFVQFLKELGEDSEAPPSYTAVIGPANRSQTRNHFRNLSTPNQHRWRQNGERAPLLRRHSLGPVGDDEETQPQQPVAGGTVLGIHNLAIVMPQFIVSSCTRAFDGGPFINWVRRLQLSQARSSKL